MKRFILTILAISLAAPAYAGNLVREGLDDPHVAVPESSTQSWSGFYLGAGITKRRTTTTTTDLIPDGYERKCSLGDSRSTHNNNKCVLSKETYDHLLSEGTYREVDSPWNHRALAADGQPGEAVLYDNVGYHGLWMNDNAMLSFGSTYGGEAPSRPSKPTSNSVIGQTFQELVSVAEDEEITGEVFARALRDTGTLVFGGEVGYNGSNAYLEGQAGIDMGQMLAYGGYGTDGAVAGLDLRVRQNMIVGVKATFEDDYVRPSLRVAFQF